MNFISFKGNKKTKDSFLKKMKDYSKNTEQLLSNLRYLNIFTTVNKNNKKIELNEKSNQFRLKLSPGDGVNFSAKFPNIFGSGEFLKVNYNQKNECGCTIGKPFFVLKNLCKQSIGLFSENRNINDRLIETKRAEITTENKKFRASVGIEMIENLRGFYASIKNRMFGVEYQGKYGYSNNKISDYYMRNEFTKRMFLDLKGIWVDSSLGFGTILGKSNFTDRFFRGSLIRGYNENSVAPMNQNKKIGGNAFLESRNKIGTTISGLNIFVFGDYGICSSNGLSDCFRILKEGEISNCVGKSIGCGVSMSSKNNISLIYAIPLTNNNETKRYNIFVDADF